VFLKRRAATDLNLTGKIDLARPDDSRGERTNLGLEDLANLPEGVRGELEAAVISLDRHRLALLASQISHQHAKLGATLAQLIDVSAYTPIFEALERSKENLTHTKV
jgi:hypothetical protein